MATPEIGKTVLHYRILRKLGEGGMGSVYLAEDTKLNRKVALKFLPPEMVADQERRQRFEREAKTVAALNHPNIVTIFSVEEDRGEPFLVMELVEGKPLNEIVPAEGLPLEKFFDVAVPLAEAVSAAHEGGITHRDLKPGNIMVTGEGRVKILDFGLAKLLRGSEVAETSGAATQTLTKAGRALGTITYMAPEQLKGKAPDQRGDIFALGVVLYQMASGKQPFSGETSAEVISSILRDTPPAITDLKLELPSHLGRIVKRCLEKSPRRRYQSAAELRGELQELKREIDSGHVFEEEAKTRVLTIQRRGRRRIAVATGIVAASALITLLGLWVSERPRATKAPGPAPPTGDAAIIAVLPFVSVGSTQPEFFTDGLNEEVTSRLTSLAGLYVVSRATAAQQSKSAGTTREIGELLGADFVVVGTVRWGTSEEPFKTARTTLQVIRTADDIQVWAASYDREFDNGLPVQSEIAQHLVRGVAISVLGLSEDELPPAPELVERPALAAATSEPSSGGPKRPPAGEDSRASPAESQATLPQSGAVKVKEVPIDSGAADSPPGARLVTLEIAFTSYSPEGVLTLYADDQQILREEFRFRPRRGFFGRRRPAGSLTARRRISASTTMLRVYALVGSEVKLSTLEPDLSGADLHRLKIVLTRRGEIDSRLY